MQEAARRDVRTPMMTRECAVHVAVRSTAENRFSYDACGTTLPFVNHAWLTFTYIFDARMADDIHTHPYRMVSQRCRVQCCVHADGWHRVCERNNHHTRGFLGEVSLESEHL